uniref:Uncharacterized protein n=1 Tax=Ditylenchus dipsaci TaxID=166011 RepID=A0A915D0I6_9BILA
MWFVTAACNRCKGFFRRTIRRAYNYSCRFNGTCQIDKRFFRRTIRRAYNYSCRFNGTCQIDKHNRAVCRACRYARCILYGMKVDAVQNERDLIGKRARSFSTTVPPTSPTPIPVNSSSPPPTISVTAPSVSHASMMCGPEGGGIGDMGSPTGNVNTRKRAVSGRAGASNGRPNKQEQQHSVDSSQPDHMPEEYRSSDPWDSSTALLELLLKSEEKIKSLRETVIKETGKLEYTTKREPSRIVSNGRKATVNDIFHSLHSQLLLVIEWAKGLEPFAKLSTEDQTSLLKNFASQHIVLCVAYRSINASDTLKLINDSCIPRANGDENEDFYKKDCERVMDQLVAPMRFMQMDDVEFVAMKACILFNPVAKGLSSNSVMRVLETRRKIFCALQDYAQQKYADAPNRIGDLTFFILSPLQSLAKSVSEDVLVTKLSGVARIDQLMEELILEDTEPKERSIGHLNKSLSTSAEFSEEHKVAPLSPSSAPAGLPYLQEVLSPSSVYRGRNGTCSSTSSSSTSPPLMSLHASLRAPQLRNINLNSSSVSNGNNVPPSALSPIHDFEMFSTLSSYVLGGPLQAPIISPSNDVLLSSSSAVSEPATSPSPSTTVMNCMSGMFQPSISATSNGGPALFVGNQSCQVPVAGAGMTSPHTLLTTTSGSEWSPQNSTIMINREQQQNGIQNTYSPGGMCGGANGSRTITRNAANQQQYSPYSTSQPTASLNY